MIRKVRCSCSKEYIVSAGLAKITCPCGQVLQAPEFIPSAPEGEGT